MNDLAVAVRYYWAICHEARPGRPLIADLMGSDTEADAHAAGDAVRLKHGYALGKGYYTAVQAETI